MTLFVTIPPLVSRAVLRAGAGWPPGCSHCARQSPAVRPRKLSTIPSRAGHAAMRSSPLARTRPSSKPFPRLFSRPTESATPASARRMAHTRRSCSRGTPRATCKARPTWWASRAFGASTGEAPRSASSIAVPSALFCPVRPAPIPSSFWHGASLRRTVLATSACSGAGDSGLFPRLRRLRPRSLSGR
jgi:hypothetical protein